MAETRRRFDPGRAGTVRIVRETGKPIAQVARHLQARDDRTRRRVCGYRREDVNRIGERIGHGHRREGS